MIAEIILIPIILGLLYVVWYFIKRTFNNHDDQIKTLTKQYEILIQRIDRIEDKHEERYNKLYDLLLNKKEE